MQRVPPNDKEAEQVILASLLIAPHLFEEVADLVDHGDFYEQRHRAIYEAACDLKKRGLACDAVAVGGWLSDRQRLEEVGGVAALAHLCDATPAMGNLRQHAERIRGLSRIRNAISTCQRIAAEGYTEALDPQEFLDAAEQRIFAIAGQEQAREAVSVHSAIREAWEQIRAASESGGGVTGTPTGFVELDKLTTGLHPGELYVVAGRPGMGKTSLVLNALTNIALSGIGAMLFSLEMPAPQLVQRVLACEGRVDVKKLRGGDLTPGDWQRLGDAAASLEGVPLWIDDKSGITLLEMRARCRRLQSQLQQQGKKLGVVAIDYLQLMGGGKSAQNREQEIAELSRGLKRMAKELSVPVIALSQLNRSVETRSAKDKRPQLSDLRESGAIEQDADAIMFVYRDEYYFKDSPDVGKAEVILAKQRSGPTGSVMLSFAGEFTRFDNLSPVGDIEFADEFDGEW